MNRASQHLTRQHGGHGSILAAVCCGILAICGLAAQATAEPVVLGGSGKPAIEVNPGALGAGSGHGLPGLGSGYGGGLLYPGEKPADGWIGKLHPPGGKPPAKSAETQAEGTPMPQLTRPAAPPAFRPPAAPAATAPAARAAMAPPPPPAVTTPPPAPPPPSPPASAALPPASMPTPPAAPAAATPAPRATPPAAPASAPAKPETPLAMRSSEEGPMFSLSFEPGAAELSDAAKSQISKLAAKVKSDGGRLQLKAFASAVGGNASQARRTSLSRALAVRTYFIQEGLRSSVMDVRALGKPNDGGREDRVDVILLER